jgi:glutathione reductase (NADPH)
MRSENYFDYIVIGAGSGGIATANRAASYGKKVALIEKNIIGGTCVNVGCVPKKIMWHASQIAEALELANNYGFNINQQLDANNFNWKQLINSTNDYISRIHKAYTNIFQKNKITLITAEAYFFDSNTVIVAGEKYHAEHICIATGGYPKVPDIPGANYGITSNDFFSLQQQPKKIVIIGSGYIAVEIASFLNSIGTDTTIIARKNNILTSFDNSISSSLAELLQQQGIKILFNTLVTKIDNANNSLNIHLNNNSSIQADTVLWAIGRLPAVESLKLASAAVNTDTQGYIAVDNHQNTSQANIYAIGDNTGNIQLTPVAIAAGRKLADRIFNSQKQSCICYKNIASVIFSHPPVGTIGMTEKQAINTFGKANIKIYTSEFKPMYLSVANINAITTIKMITLATTDKIIGLHIIGVAADEMLQGFAVAIKMGATRSDFNETIAIHPTSAEEVVLIK